MPPQLAPLSKKVAESMFKLLPDNLREKVTKEYSLRRVAVMLSLLAALGILGGVAVLPSLIFIRERSTAASFTLSVVESTKAVVNKSALESWLARLQIELQSLAPDPIADIPYEYFQKILSVKPAGVTISGLSWNRPSSTIFIRARGIARDRQTLLNFQSKLNSSGDWSQVDFPVDTIAREADIPFEMTLTPKKPS